MATRVGLARGLTLGLAFTFAFAFALGLGACGKKDKEGSGSGDKSGQTGETASISGGDTIKIDGSSTVFPISQAVAEEFQDKHDAKITVAASGTGGGFKKFCRGEIAVTGASRPIKPTEIQVCKEAGIEFVELPVAYDGIAVVVHKDNDWVDQMTVAELKSMWAPESATEGIKSWSQLRDGWPDKAFHLFGPGVDSGTYDYFTKAIVGTEHASRGDFTASEDDNVLVQGVATDPVALGFFGYAYYKENADKLKIVAIDDGDASNGEGAIEPDLETVANGTYQPLSRPIFIYVSTADARRPEIVAFVEFYLTEGSALSREVGYIPLPDNAYELARKRFASRVTGSLFEGGSRVGVTIEDLLAVEGK